jgi:hypothetical protein
MDWNPSDTAVVFIDPQNDVLSPTGINWAATGASVTENDTVAHMLAIFEAAQARHSGCSSHRTTSIPPITGGCLTVRWRQTNCAPVPSTGRVR